MSRTKAFLLTFLISMLPIIELRGAIPFAATINTSPEIAFIEALPVAVLGNIIPVPFIIIFFNLVHISLLHITNIFNNQASFNRYLNYTARTFVCKQNNSI